MFDAKLGNIPLTIDYLWVVVVSLGLYLLSLHFLKDVALCLVHAHHIRVDRRPLQPLVKIMIVYIL